MKDTETKETDMENTADMNKDSIADAEADMAEVADSNGMNEGNPAGKKADEREKYEATIKDLTETLLRIQAEFENYKKRVDAQKKDLIAEASKNVLSELTPVLDNFDLALKHSGNISKEDLITGFRMIQESLVKIMKDNGLEEINPKDQKFNPFEHEAIGCEECKGKQSHTVIEVMQIGYKINGKVIRSAKVKIAK